MNTYLNNFNQHISSDEAAVLFVFGLFAFVWMMVFIGMTINHFLLAIPLYIMADKAGYSHPFLAFIPFANYYLAHILPMKEYNYIGMFRTYERGKGFALYMVLKYAVPFGVGIIVMVFSMIPFIGYMVAFVSQFISWAVFAAHSIGKAVMVSDLIQTYIKKSDKGLAIFLGVLSIFVPIAFPIACIALCTKEPEFGFGNFYCPVSFHEEEE